MDDRQGETSAGDRASTHGARRWDPDAGATPVDVLVVGRNHLHRHAVTVAVAAAEAMTCVGAVDAPDDTAGRTADVVVVDHDPGGHLHASAALAGRAVVITSLPVALDPVLAWVDAGARGLLSLDAGLDELTRAVRAVARGEAACSPTLTTLLLQALRAPGGGLAGADTLTPREHEVAVMLEHGLSNKEIARRLGIAQSTVKNHVHNVLTKLEVAGRGRVRLTRLRAAGPDRSI